MTEALLTGDNLLSRLDDEAHVWVCYPDEIKNLEILQAYRLILSTQENARQQRFRFEQDKHQYLVSHALVRKVLSRYCEIPPEKWVFTTNQHGRPEIASSIDCPALRFNLSHADGMAVCVVTLRKHCGVDVENTERQSRLLPLARRMFAQQELDVLLDTDDDEIGNKFFQYWTLREAYVKALGTGLGGSSKQFYFKVHEQTSVVDICFANDYAENNADWRCVLLEPSEKHQVAVIVQLEQEKSINIISQKICP
ncbi:MAG: 4'-phosphopantetheinyl transferase superfamily protein [Gammaproteobacteria bacterium]|nr:4'-phosphopantetheinyl transferase superfamily protein [Gammaproteobacteria bacterium]